MLGAGPGTEFGTVYSVCELDRGVLGQARPYTRIRIGLLAHPNRADCATAELSCGRRRDEGNRFHNPKVHPCNLVYNE